MENLSIFNIGQHAQELNQEMYGNGGGSDLFDIRVENGKSTSFVIRVLPYIKDVRQTKVKKFFYAIPNGQNTLIYDSMTTFNNPALGQYHFCPISDIWMKLNNNQDANVKEIAKQIRRQTRIIAYVQIIACPDKPDLNGTFMPMSIPYELEKAMRNLANPDDAQKALGYESITAYDLFKGIDFTCTITGHKPLANGPVMRKWTIKESAPCEIKLPLGPNGAMTPISQLQESQVVAYFNEQQTVDIVEKYGLKTANLDANIVAYNWLRGVCGYIPGMSEAIDANFKDVVQHLRSQEIGAMNGGQNAPVQTQQTTYGAPVSSGNPMAAQAPQSVNEVAQAPQGNPMNAQAPQGNPMNAQAEHAVSNDTAVNNDTATAAPGIVIP